MSPFLGLGPRKARRTLLLIAADCWLRVDLARDGRACNVAGLEAHPGQDVLAATRELLTRGGPPAAHVSIIAEAFWTQTVELPIASVQGLSADEVDRAIAWELEPSSGIRAPEALVVARRLPDPAPGRARLWTLSLRASDSHALVEIAAQYGARIDHLAHPAGLVPESSEPGALCVEVFDHATWISGPTGLRVIAARPAQRSWEQALRDALSQATTVACVWRGRARAQHSPAPEFASGIDDRGPWDFEREGEAWLERAARTLATRAVDLPVLHPRAPSRAGIAPIVVGVLLTALVAAWAWRDQRQLGALVKLRELEAANAELAVNETRALQKEQLTIAAQETELRKTVSARRTKLAPIAPEWKAQSERLSALFSSLSRQRPAGLTVLRLRGSALGAVGISGIGLDSAAIDRYVAELAPVLRAARWDLSPARNIERRGSTGRTFVEFELTAAPLIGDASPAPVPRTSSRAKPVEAAARDRRQR